MTNYRVKMSNQAKSDREKYKDKPALKNKLLQLVDLISRNPYECPPSYEKLTGDLKGFYSRRINKQHRLVYSVRETESVVMIFSMWTHYE